MDSETLLRAFDALPDLRQLALESDDDGSDDPAVRQAKITADYIARKESFKVSEDSDSSTCSECGEEVSGTYEIFRDGAKQAYTVGGQLIHAAREHGLVLRDAHAELAALLLDVHNQQQQQQQQQSEPKLVDSTTTASAGADSISGTAAARGVKRPLPPAITIDRENVCPFQLRVFVKLNEPHREEDFVNLHKLEERQAGSEHRLYTWRDATLRELADVLSREVPEARRWGARLHFASVFAGGTGPRRFVRELGVVNRALRTRDDFKTLDQARYQLGDLLAVAIFDPSTAGPLPPSPSAAPPSAAAAVLAPVHGRRPDFGDARNSSSSRLDAAAGAAARRLDGGAGGGGDFRRSDGNGPASRHQDGGRLSDDVRASGGRR